VPDDRDRRVPKTPPAGVRAQTAAPLDEVAPEAETSAAIENPEQRQAWRAKQPWEDRLDKVEKKADKTELAIAKMEGQLEFLVEGQKASNEERQARREREEREATQALERAKLVAEQLEKARERRAATLRAFLAILVPLVTAIGVIIAVILGRSAR